MPSARNEEAYRAGYYAAALVTLGDANVKDLPLSTRTAIADARLYIAYLDRRGDATIKRLRTIIKD